MPGHQEGQKARQDESGFPAPTSASGFVPRGGRAHRGGGAEDQHVSDVLPIPRAQALPEDPGGRVDFEGGEVPPEQEDPGNREDPVRAQQPLPKLEQHPQGQERRSKVGGPALQGIKIKCPAEEAAAQ